MLATQMLPTQEVVDFLKQYKSTVEIIMTGRGAPEELIKIADLVTDMSEVSIIFTKELALVTASTIEVCVISLHLRYPL